MYGTEKFRSQGTGFAESRKDVPRYDFLELRTDPDDHELRLCCRLGFVIIVRGEDTLKYLGFVQDLERYNGTERAIPIIDRSPAHPILPVHMGLWQQTGELSCVDLRSIKHLLAVAPDWGFDEGLMELLPGRLTQ